MVLMEQVHAMLNFFEKHPQMFHGWSQNKEGRSLSKKYWKDCAAILNSVCPDCPTKTPQEWRVYYNEFKSKTLRRVRAQKCFPTGKPIVLSPTQKRLYNLLGGPDNTPDLLPSQVDPVQLSKSLDEMTTAEQDTPEQETNGQTYSLPTGNVEITFEDDSGDDPLHPVKEESRWTGYDDTDTRDSDILDDMLGSRPSITLNTEDTSRKQGSRVSARSVERAEELHRLAVAERIWALKTLRERHHAAKLERELMQLRRDRARLLLERARRQQD